MTVQIAHLYATGCLAIIFFQVGLIAGLPLGPWTQGGRFSGALPLRGRLVAMVSIPVLIFMGLAILSAAGFPGLGWPRWTVWAALGVQAISMVLNWITPSRPERVVWGPVTSVMAAMAVVVVTA